MDLIEHPPHYERHSVTIRGITYQPIDLLAGLPFSLGCACKYLIRYQDKGCPADDLRKAIWYLGRYLADGCPTARPPADLTEAYMQECPLLDPLLWDSPVSPEAVRGALTKIALKLDSLART